MARRLSWIGLACAAIIVATVAMTWLTGLAAPRDHGPRKVFAHYMVCCPRAGANAGLADFRKDIEDARDVGIDGFALNIGDWTGANYKRITALMFQAAELAGPDFKLFFSADQISAEDTIDMLAGYRSHANYLRVDGRPVLSGFGTDGAWGRKVRALLDARDHTRVFLVPFYFGPSRRELPTTIDILAMPWLHSDLDGFFAFGTAGPYAALADVIRREAVAWHGGGHLFMAGVAPYYRGLQGNYRVFESDGFAGFLEQWRAAIESGADWVELTTWNDWGESSYLAPVARDESPIADGNQWGRLPTHRGFLGLARFMIAWFKTGRQPPVEQEQAFIAYRLHPATAQGDRAPPNRKLDRPDGADTLRDQVHLVTLLRAPATAVMRVGEQVTRQDMAAGMGSLLTPMQPGTVSVTLERAGKSVGRLEGKLPISVDGTAGNFNIYADGGALTP